MAHFHHLLFIVPYFFAIGILVGCLSMLFGIGGGLLIVPATNLFLLSSGFDPNISMKVAIATSLITIVASTLNVLYRQNKSGYVLWPLVGKFLPFVILGAFCGMLISSEVSGLYLSYLFVVFLAFVIVYSFFKRDFQVPYQLHDFREPKMLNKGVVGFVVGNMSLLIGVGGNILFVPYLRYFRLPMKNAAAFTVAIMPILALLGSIDYIVSGFHATEILPPYCFGYVSVPAFVLIFAGSFAGALMGQRLLKLMNDKFQARAYLFFLIVVFLLMLSSTHLFSVL